MLSNGNDKYMATFKYHAKNKAGKIVSGEVQSPNLKLAQQTLEEKGLEIAFLQEVRARFAIPFLRGRVSAKDLVIFSRQLATLAGANIRLVQALNIVAEQTISQELKKVIPLVADDVEAGTRLSLALSKHPHVFDTFFVNMIKSGETAGRLSEVLEYLADQTEKEYDLVSKVRGALMYPAFIVVGMIIVGVVLLVFVIPQLTQVLIESGAELPITTRLLIASSSFVKTFWWLILIILTGAVVGFKMGLKNLEFKSKVDKFKLRLPILGPLLQRIYLARITRSLQILISGGVDLVSALAVVGEVSGNNYYKKLIEETRKEVDDGNSIITVFKDSPLIPAMVVQMLAVGEETGQMAGMLEKLTAFYTREVSNSVTVLVSVIEPLLMVVIGIGVGLVVASIILPMYQLAGQF